MVAVAVLLWWWSFRRTKEVYLLDYACYRPPPSLKLSCDKFMMGTIRTRLVQTLLLSCQACCLPPGVTVTENAAEGNSRAGSHTKGSVYP